MTSITFFAIRAKKDFNNFPGEKIGSPENPYSFKKGWYIANAGVKPPTNMKIFPQASKAEAYLKVKKGIGFDLIRKDYFEVVPVQVTLPD